MNNATFAVSEGWDSSTSHMTCIFKSKHFSEKLLQIVISSNAQYWKYIRPIVSIFISRARVSHTLQMEAHSPVSCNPVYLYRVIKKSLYTWWLQYRKLQQCSKCPPPVSRHLLTCQTVFSKTMFSIAQSTFQMCSVMAIFKSSIVWGLLYCNCQVYRDILITLHDIVFMSWRFKICQFPLMQSE